MTSACTRDTDSPSINVVDCAADRRIKWLRISLRRAHSHSRNTKRAAFVFCFCPAVGGSRVDARDVVGACSSTITHAKWSSIRGGRFGAVALGVIRSRLGASAQRCLFLKRSHGLDIRVPVSTLPFDAGDLPTLGHAVRRLEKADGKRGFSFVMPDGSTKFVAYPELGARALALGSALVDRGIAQGQVIGLVLSDPEAFVVTFFAALARGIVPTPIYP